MEVCVIFFIVSGRKNCLRVFPIAKSPVFRKLFQKCMIFSFSSKSTSLHFRDFSCRIANFPQTFVNFSCSNLTFLVMTFNLSANIIVLTSVKYCALGGPLHPNSWAVVSEDRQTEIILARENEVMILYPGGSQPKR